MQRRNHGALAALLGLLTVLGGAPLAQAGGHMSGYTLTPEHDDTGRSNEPSFDGATGILGVGVSERAIDANLDGLGEAYASSKDAAPGCSDDTGRRPSGLCWLALTTNGAAGVPGMSGSAAPGSFTPNKGTKVRVMDLISTLQVVRAYVEPNKKLDDTGVRPILSSIDSDFGNALVPPAVGATMWYGTWQDKNGNGVIDAEGAAPFSAAMEARNEFMWEGYCKTFTGGNSAVPPWVCDPVADGEKADIYVWAYPGNHHASTNGGTAVFSPADLPGQQALCFAFVASVVGPVVQNAVVQNTGATAVGCPNSIGDIEENDSTFDVGTGDPLLGNQGDLRPDFSMAHRTGDPNPNTRHLVAGLGWPMYYYDQSLLVSYTTVAALNAPAEPGSARQYRVQDAQMIDVDRYQTFSPEAEQLLTQTVKPAARSQWVTVRDAYIPINQLVDGKVNSHATGLGFLNTVQGPVDDVVLDPGLAHEPNHPLDVYPQVVRGALPSFDGSTSSYAGYASLRLDKLGHLFADGNLFRTEPLIRPGMPPPLIAPPVPAGPFASDSFSPTPLRVGSESHARSLSPGAYDFLGGLGAWHDRTQVNVEEVFGSPPVSYLSAPDGWVGNVVNSTGQYRYRDYLPEVCTLQGVVGGTHEYAQCHPYADGTISQPNDFGTDDGEMTTGCGGIGNSVGTLEIIPVSGTWTFPVFVYRNLEEMTVGDLRQIEDKTGSAGAFTITVSCAQANFINARDYIVLPLGNLGGAVQTRWTASATTVPGEVVVDVDEYAAFGA